MTDRLQLRIDRTDTPLGPLTLVANAVGHLCLVGWDDGEGWVARSLRLRFGDHFVVEPRRNPAGLTDALAAYFAGELSAIDGLPVEARGTRFQESVWSALRKIPCGTTISYGALAHRIGKPSAVRAVGLANGANPVGVVVPCHRVIGASGALTGYGGGIDRKRWLLVHEGAIKGGQPPIPLTGG